MKFLNHYDIDSIKEHHTEIHPFGLGFIQVKFDYGHRMHFWHPDFKREREEVHDHRYDFDSLILGGSMRQEVYRFAYDPNGDYELCSVSCEPGKEEKPLFITCGNLVHEISCTFHRGCSYTINENTLHRIEADFCVTLLRRRTKTKTHAHVVKPRGSVSVCPFSEKMTEDQMWNIVSDCLNRIDAK